MAIWLCSAEVGLRTTRPAGLEPRHRFLPQVVLHGRVLDQQLLEVRPVELDQLHGLQGLQREGPGLVEQQRRPPPRSRPCAGR